MRITVVAQQQHVTAVGRLPHDRLAEPTLALPERIRPAVGDFGLGELFTGGGDRAKQHVIRKQFRRLAQQRAEGPVWFDFAIEVAEFPVYREYAFAAVDCALLAFVIVFPRHGGSGPDFSKEPPVDFDPAARPGVDACMAPWCFRMERRNDFSRNTPILSVN